MVVSPVPVHRAVLHQDVASPIGAMRDGERGVASDVLNQDVRGRPPNGIDGDTVVAGMDDGIFQHDAIAAVGIKTVHVVPHVLKVRVELPRLNHNALGEHVSAEQRVDGPTW